MVFYNWIALKLNIVHGYVEMNEKKIVLLMLCVILYYCATLELNKIIYKMPWIDDFPGFSWPSTEGNLSLDRITAVLYRFAAVRECDVRYNYWYYPHSSLSKSSLTSPNSWITWVTHSRNKIQSFITSFYTKIRR